MYLLTREIMEKEKEIHASFAIVPQTTEVMVTVQYRCLVKMGKALNFTIRYFERERDYVHITFIAVSEHESRSVVSNSLRPHGLYSPWNSPGQNTGVGSPSRLQGIFPTQGSNPGLPHCRPILYQLSRKGKAFITVYCYNCCILLSIVVYLLL